MREREQNGTQKYHTNARAHTLTSQRALLFVRAHNFMCSLLPAHIFMAYVYCGHSFFVMDFHVFLFISSFFG